jgi:hypothetical protein
VAIVRREVLVAAWRRLAQAGALAAAIAVVVLAYPLFVFFAGPQHVAGPYWPYLTGLRGPGSVLPTAGYGTASRAVSSAGYEGPRGPGTGYLGFGIFAVAALGFAVAVRRQRCAVVVIATLACLCLQANLLAVAFRVAIFDDIVVVRYAIGTTLCLSLLLAMAIDGCWTPARPLSRALRARWGTAGSALCAVLVAAVAIVPVAAAYDVPFEVQTAHVPTWFTTAGTHVPSGTPVLVLPFAWYTSDEAMAWQAESGLRFALVGGFGFIPGADGRRDEFLSRRPDARLLQSLSRGHSLSDVQRARLRGLLRGWAPLEVVVIDHHTAHSVVATLERVLGRPSAHGDGATTWVLARRAPSGARTVAPLGAGARS